MSWFFPFDLPFTTWAQSFQSHGLTGAARFISAVSDTEAYFVLVPLLAWYLYRRGWRIQALSVVLAAAGNILNPVLKALTARPRPVPELVAVLGDGNGSFSFPSGHALGAVIFYGLLAYLALNLPGFPRKRLVAYFCPIFIVLVGLSRVYLGVHWLSDVLAGYILGGLWLGLVIYWYQKARKRNEYQ